MWADFFYFLSGTPQKGTGKGKCKNSSGFKASGLVFVGSEVRDLRRLAVAVDWATSKCSYHSFIGNHWRGLQACPSVTNPLSAELHVQS